MEWDKEKMNTSSDGDYGKLDFSLYGLTGKSESEIAQIDIEEKEHNKQARFEKSGIGERYFKCRLDNFDPYTEELKKNLTTVIQYISNYQNDKKNLLFCGKNGTGKTFLAAVIIRELGGTYITAYELVDKIKDTFNSSAKSRESIVQTYIKSQILVIDEITKFQSDFDKEVLYKILAGRYDKGFTTILISNQNANDVKRYLGKAIVDRLSEDGVLVLNFTGESYRGKK